ncbi:4-hydroxythreonine-4-phosphate dehydrogenase PdxA [Achromobacter sp. Marseille-Q0513]|uniref:4-hydroxythreonine-4-phosphate dehydrogenase PdxA n=1 Tax=unclassified Achromobacter TaxID=2626865 RepID=UPI001B9ECBF6|nr:4-hydroxythreonine-4-phosphate dehydrogenase PdxA [Achromobacter sp. Marseille-Q0513]MBR8656115.1 4-hydroxythreonine-4-phosphate dehydrogenase PdxA [Achromobacter sp. Marseille-Q0513]
MTQSNSRNLPLLAVTLGDVAGIGPEITAKMLMGHEALRAKARLVVVGDAAVMANAVRGLGGDPSIVRTVARPADATNAPGTIEVVQAGPSLAHVKLGEISAEAGDGSVRFVTTACALARAGEVDAIVTAPLNKAAMHAAGHKWPGHTELLAHEFGVKTFSLVLSAGDLYVFHATTHVSLRQAIEDVNPARMRAVLRLAGAFAKALGRGDKPVAVAGLNPHAGENGIFGSEDADILAPAVAEANAAGILAAGPIPADALFPQAVRGKWEFVIACYHDQGHAPFKSVYGDDGVNITVGLPVVRVSVDHGTAFDIAGKGIAREDSLVLAAERAANLAPGWSHVWETARAQTGG